MGCAKALLKIRWQFARKMAGNWVLTQMHQCCAANPFAQDTWDTWESGVVTLHSICHALIWALGLHWNESWGLGRKLCWFWGFVAFFSLIFCSSSKQTLCSYSITGLLWLLLRVMFSLPELYCPPTSHVPALESFSWMLALMDNSLPRHPVLQYFTSHLIKRDPVRAFC